MLRPILEAHCLHVSRKAAATYKCKLLYAARYILDATIAV